MKRIAFFLAPLLAVLAACDMDERRIAVGQEILLRQVASDIQVTFDPKVVGVRDDGGDFYYVCGVATLNRPGSGELALNNVRQRYIVTVNRDRRVGGALFDGASDVDGKNAFARELRDKCPSGHGAFDPAVRR